MKKICISMSLAAMMAVCSCGGNDGEEKKVSLTNAKDSLSFAVSMAKSEPLNDIVYRQFGIDSANIKYFVKGVRDAFPLENDPQTEAYSKGLSIGAQALSVWQGANSEVYPNDSVNQIDKKKFLEGLIAGIYNSGKTMTIEKAVEYFNQTIYMSKSNEFMAENKKREGVVTLPSGLQYKMEVTGTGLIPTANDSVSCIYKGTMTDGRTFDSSRGKEVTFAVKDMIPGFAEALQILPQGSKCKVYIPWDLAYGEKGASSIPPYSTLVFDLEIMKVIPAKQ